MPQGPGLPFVLLSPFDAGFRARLEGCTRDAPKYERAALTREWIRGYDAAQAEIDRNARLRYEGLEDARIY